MSITSQTLFLAGSAAFVGLVHSLAPGHWLPVVLMTKARRWPIRTAIVGALTAASGHIFVSMLLGLAVILVGAHYVHDLEVLENYAGYALIVFGLAYALYAWRTHSHCHGHEHHGPEPTSERGPFLFLFLLGFSPCLAVFPIFAAAATQGTVATVMTMGAFSLGVIGALVAGTVLVSLGFMRLDHPIFEHHGDVITGLGVAAMGIVLLLLPHQHHAH